MSRIGIKSIQIPKGVSVQTKNGTIEVKGAKGKLSRRIPQGITTEIDSGVIKVERMNELKST